MKIIGLTGGSGVGKTMVCKIIEERGSYVVNADKIAKEVVALGKPALFEIIEEFGREILLQDGNLDRSKLGRLVFSNPVALQKLNQITHPRIVKEIQCTIDNMQKEARYDKIVLDAPLLFETGLHEIVDEIWVVTAPIELRISRIMERDRLTEEEAKKRILSQTNPEKYIGLARVVIENVGDLKELEKQVLIHLQG